MSICVTEMLEFIWLLENLMLTYPSFQFVSTCQLGYWCGRSDCWPLGLGPQSWMQGVTVFLTNNTKHTWRDLSVLQRDNTIGMMYILYHIMVHTCMVLSSMQVEVCWYWSSSRPSSRCSSRVFRQYSAIRPPIPRKWDNLRCTRFSLFQLQWHWAGSFQTRLFPWRCNAQNPTAVMRDVRWGTGSQTPGCSARESGHKGSDICI